MTTIAGTQIVPVELASLPALRAADQGVADALESVLSDNTRRVYGTQWKLFADWCDEVGLPALPAQPLTVARYLAARANAGASIATMRLATSAIAKAHEWVKPGITVPGPGRARLPERMGKTTCEAPAPVRRPHRRRPGRDPAHRRPAPQARPRLRNARAGRRACPLRPGPGGGAVRRGVEAFRGGVADLGRRCALGRRQRRITVIRSKTDVEAQGAVVAITPAAMRSLGRHPAGGRRQRGESVRAVGVADRPAGEGDCQSRGVWPTGSSSAGTAGGWAWHGAWPRTARPPTRSSARAAGNRAAAWSAATPAVSPPVRHCVTCRSWRPWTLSA